MITAPGIGSGLDIADIVSRLIALEGEPATLRFDQKEAQLQAEISGLGFLKSALSEFNSALTNLKLGSTFAQRAATSSDPDSLTANASSSASPGSYSIEVMSLAQAHKLASAGFSGPDAEVGSGTLTIISGVNASSVTIDPAAKSLADVRGAINEISEQTGVAATIINVDDGVGGSVSKLLLTASETGTAHEITVNVVDDDGDSLDNVAGLSRLVYQPADAGVKNMTEAQPAVDAEIAVDQQTVTRGTNTLSDVIEGVTLNLLAAAPGLPISLTVSNDQESIREAMREFADAYSSLRETITSLTRYDPVTEDRGVLLGDAGLLNLSTQLQREMGRQFDVGGAFSTLSEVGLRAQADGTMALDESVLTGALETDLDAVTQLFTSTDGFATRLSALVDGLVAANGVLDTRTAGLDSLIDDINDGRDALDRRLVSLEERLLAQYAAMDSLVAQLQSTSTFLTQQLTSIRGLSDRGNSQ